MNRIAIFALSLVFIIGSTTVVHAAVDTELQEINGLYQQGQYNTALDRANAYIAKNPQDAQARFLKGLILTRQNNSAAAISVFSGLTEDFPELPEPYNNLAVLYAAQGQYEQAKHALEMAIHTHPDYAVAEENLGDIYAKMAAIAYGKALQLATTDTAVQSKLALVQQIFTVPKPAEPAINTK